LAGLSPARMAASLAALDPGRATEPRVAAPHMLPSTCLTASAPASLQISWLNPTPHTIAVYASPWSSPSTPQHSLLGGRYPLPRPDFRRLELASFPDAPGHFVSSMPAPVASGWSILPGGDCTRWKKRRLVTAHVDYSLCRGRTQRPECTTFRTSHDNSWARSRRSSANTSLGSRWAMKTSSTMTRSAAGEAQGLRCLRGQIDAPQVRSSLALFCGLFRRDWVFRQEDGQVLGNQGSGVDNKCVRTGIDFGIGCVSDAVCENPRQGWRRQRVARGDGHQRRNLDKVELARRVI
jgi:hypothetical protein